MSDWQVGDLAVCVIGCELPHDSTQEPNYGAEAIVSGVCQVGPGYTGDQKTGLRLVLSFVGHDDWYCAGCFRKVTPDDHEACQPEFVTLLKRTKRKVRA